MFVLPRILRVKTIICRAVLYSFGDYSAHFGAPQGTFEYSSKPSGPVEYSSRVFLQANRAGVALQSSIPANLQVYYPSLLVHKGLECINCPEGPVFSRAQLKNIGICYRQLEYPSLLVDRGHRISNTRDTTSVLFGRSVQLDELADPVLQIDGLIIRNRCRQSPIKNCKTFPKLLKLSIRALNLYTMSYMLEIFPQASPR